ncbi:MAG: ectoine/hydroxyectoine ABC transporter substrate-binding protein EhuB, partial [Alphaproteobacteria bacterium HGW-Alphaproteobacteria-10]
PEWAAILTDYGFTQSDVDGSSTRTTAELCTG